MSKAVKVVVAVAVAVAIPFVAPAIASSIGATAAISSAATTLGASTAAAATIGATVGAAATGAVLGAAGAAVTGNDIEKGAIMGGLAGGFAGYSSATAANNAAAANPEVTAAAENVGSNIVKVDATTGSALLADGTTIAANGAVTAPTITSAAKAGFSTTITGLASNPETLKKITAMALGNADISGLSPEEQELVELRKAELKRMASDNRALFEQQVLAAQEFMQMADQQQGNPEAAYAETKIRSERQLNEDTRGLSADRAAGLRRASQIDSTESGTIASAAEEERGQAASMRLRQAGLSALPTASPEGYAGLASPYFQDLAERKRQAQADLVYGASRVMGIGGGSSDTSSSTSSNRGGLYGGIG